MKNKRTERSKNMIWAGYGRKAPKFYTATRGYLVPVSGALVVVLFLANHKTLGYRAFGKNNLRKK